MSVRKSKLIVLPTLVAAIFSCSYFQLGSTELSVAISRIPGQPAILYSGAEVTLLCVITYSGTSSLQASWHNGTQTLEGNGNVQLTAPYLVLGDVYAASAHISVLVPHTSSYRCDISSNESSISEELQVKVIDSGTEAIVDIKHPSVDIYALVPFGISCLVHVPVDVTFSFHISWLQNGELLSESDAFTSESLSLNSSAVESDALVTEPVPGEVTYTCKITGIVNGFTVFQVTRTLPTFNIQAFPEPAIQILTLPESNPMAGSSYTLSCQVIVASTLLDMVELTWLNQFGERVRGSNDITIGSQMQTGGKAVLNTEFSEVLPELEGTYTCSAKLEILQYNTMLTSESSILVVAPEQVISVQISSLLQTSTTWLVGSDAALVCTAEVVKATSVTFEWLKNSDGVIVSSESIKIAGTSQLSDNVFQSTLEFRGVLPSVADLYFCTAKLSTTSLANFFEVNVESDLPPLTVLVTSTNAMAGDETQLMCIATVPEFYQDLPLFVWTRSNGANVGDESHILETPVNNGTHAFQVLTISPVSLLDSGEYICTVAYQILGVSQDAASYIQASNILNVQVETPSVTVSLAADSTDNDSRQFTCHVQLDSLKGFIPVIITNWFFTKNTSNGMEYEQIPNLPSSQMSAVQVVSCGEEYSSNLRFVQFIVPFGTNEVVCLANVSIPNENHIISSQGKGGISIHDIVQVEKPPAEPNEPSVRDLGSSWAEIYWESPNNSSQQNYYIEYINTITQQRQESVRIFSDLFTTVSTYSTVLTDLYPATRYEFRVVTENALGLKEGNLSAFTTTEAIPTGAPQDFQREATNGEWRFTWQPPLAQSQNGAITGYNFSCYPFPRTGVLQNGSAIVTTTYMYISVDSFITDENYTCSVAARTAQGEGPVTSLQFSLLDSPEGAVAQECPQNLHIIALGVVAAVLLALCISFFLALVIYCCYRRNSDKRKYTMSATRTPTCSPPDTPSRPLNDYVLSAPPKHSQNSLNTTTNMEFSQINGTDL